MRLSFVSAVCSFDLWLFEQPANDESAVQAVAGQPSADLTLSVSDAAAGYYYPEDQTTRTGFTS